MGAHMHATSPAGRSVDDEERVAAAVQLLGLLADPTRLRLVRRLGESDADVTTLTSACAVSRTSISQHLARLRLAGVVTGRKDGRRVIYRLGHGHVGRLVDEALNAAEHQVRQLPPHT